MSKGLGQPLLDNSDDNSEKDTLPKVKVVKSLTIGTPNDPETDVEKRNEGAAILRSLSFERNEKTGHFKVSPL